VTVEFDHICNMTSDVDRSVKESELRIQANNVLIELKNSLFTGHKKFELRESSAEFQGPVIKFTSLATGHWAWNTIKNIGAAVSDSYINDFIINVEGTYAQIIVENGSLSGTYLIAVQTIG
jgi:hypothetical protein